MSNAPIEIRPAVPADLAFVFSGWLKSNRDSSFARGIRDSVYFKEHHALIERVVDGSTLLIAVNAADPDQLYGFICFEESWDIPVIHYLYVKKIFRRAGVAKRLYQAANPGRVEPFIYTHECKIPLKVQGVYSPYALFKRAGRAA